MRPYRGLPMTLGVAAAAGVRLIVWCKDCQHQVEPGPRGDGPAIRQSDLGSQWRERLVCSRSRAGMCDKAATGKQLCDRAGGPKLMASAVDYSSRSRAWRISVAPHSMSSAISS